MERCEGKAGGICTRDATWKHSIHAGNREDGRFLYNSYWCDEHAERVTQQRKQDWIAPPRMTRIAQEAQ